MTSAEIARLLNLDNGYVSRVIKKVSEYTPTLASKYGSGKLWINTNLSKEETMAVLRELGASRLRMLLIEESWSDVADTDVYTIRGTNQFVLDWNKNHRIVCCNTCRYIYGKVGNHSMPQPFCKVYGTSLTKYNIYEDYCTSYEYLELPKPRKWFKENAPKNLNIYGESDTVNGIDRKEFVSGEEWGKRPVELVNQVGFDR